MVTSVPVFEKRRCSTQGTALRKVSAASTSRCWVRAKVVPAAAASATDAATSGSPWPRITGPKPSR